MTELPDPDRLSEDEPAVDVDEDENIEVVPPDVRGNMPKVLVEMLRGKGGAVTVTASTFVDGVKVATAIDRAVHEEFPDA